MNMIFTHFEISREINMNVSHCFFFLLNILQENGNGGETENVLFFISTFFRIICHICVRTSTSHKEINRASLF